MPCMITISNIKPKTIVLFFIVSICCAKPYIVFAEESPKQYSIIKGLEISLKTSMFEDLQVTGWDTTLNSTLWNKELELLSEGPIKDENVVDFDIILFYRISNLKNVELSAGFRKIFENGAKNQIAFKFSYLSFLVNSEIFFFISTNGDISFSPTMSQELILYKNLILSLDIESNIHL